MFISRLSLLVLSAAAVAAPSMGFANGIGEGRSFQFRSEAQRQVMLTMERTHLELLGLLTSNSGLGTGGSGQTGNASSITVNGSNNVITVNQTNSGNQTQNTDCSSSTFQLGGSMFGC